MRLTAFCYVCILAMVGFPTMAQNDVENQQLFYGGTDGNSYVDDIVAAPDGGFYLVGSTKASGNTGNLGLITFGEQDIWVRKYNPDFSVAWQKAYGGTGRELYPKLVVHPTGLFLGGRTNSPISGNKTEPQKGEESIWLLKLDFDGNIEWQKTYGGLDGLNGFNDLNLLSHDTLIVTSFSYSSNTGDKTHPLVGEVDGWVLFLSPDGDIYYDKIYAGEGWDWINYTFTDENMILHFGNSTSHSTPDEVDGFSLLEHWIVATDRTGEKIWEKTIRINFGGRKTIMKKNNTIYVGVSEGNQLIENDIRTVPYKGRRDVWLVKMNLNGEIIDEYSYGGSDKEEISGIYSINEQTILLAMNSSSPPSLDKTTPIYGDVDLNDMMDPPGNHYDYWAVSIDTNGNILKQFTFGGNREDFLEHVLVLDNHIVLTGSSYSPISGNKNTSGIMSSWARPEVWTIIIDKDQLLNTKDFTTHISHVSIFPNPTTDFITIQAEEPLQSLALFDVNGKQVHQENYANQPQTDIKISIQHLPSGTYFLNYRTNSFQASKMIVKQ